MQSSSGFDVIVLAAGKGVRMRSKLPKVLHRLCGQTLVERVLYAVTAGQTPRNISVVVGFEAEQVKAELERIGGKEPFLRTAISSALQAQQNGTGHAAQIGLAALPPGDLPVVIVPGDVPLLSKRTIKRLIEAFYSGKSELIFLSCIHPNPAGFGRIVRQGGKPTAIVEHKDCTPEQLKIGEINSSIYVVGRKLLGEALGSLKNNNVQGEYYLTDIIGYAVGRGLNVEGLIIEDYQELSGANSRTELSALESIRRQRINQELMDSGITMEDPAATYIDDGVKVGPECWIGAGTRIYGRTVIGSGVVIEGSCVIRDSEISDGARIKFSCVIDSAKVGPAAQVGPFAHLRPDTDLGQDVRIGNFVEVKKSRFAKGAKANHLTYVGDAEVGSKVNIGAGTITCNYDGWNKSKTVIGEGAFIGSNSSLVAPVEVGAGAVIGAGSVITRNVPADALGLERSQQVAIEGWAGKRRERMDRQKAAKKKD